MICKVCGNAFNTTTCQMCHGLPQTKVDVWSKDKGWWINRAEELESELARARERIRNAINMIDIKIGGSCGEEAGEVFCEDFGCGSLLDIRILLEPAPGEAQAEEKR
jgi:hypothetical protein